MADADAGAVVASVAVPGVKRDLDARAGLVLSCLLAYNTAGGNAARNSAPVRCCVVGN